ncbi:MAG: Sua5/YciO/YrdC/YwlC family protein [Candidatus Cloacimonadaceae bacterium]|jgi:protein-tyrosine-phosphatase/tRNA A37 threonylcarbamoyladenosine synthetase subunit TsaC/SUA5/YrdC|nr:Sua5/YciO/YrdC/YwlC family protein [Candidatus Cloacimonadota bacterium]MDY0126563.1 Sua5/YciO/YrdC/YwlC family protein [Candidatus Cloacimonadaceae bacterium]MCB5254629.1 Sua5/YciO/YrdC/YwlC family protein [Candidatus Cloacimonadota bacterium]MCK9177716.1 Sua5/YciO/YrdC/YwlC family protein [Candidatus Cloacimonadota bacterium]MCK9241890.1 Sua5/YciO/YrdC/YwlC family protein [Candidatus Cloacimonadota bacterium]
MIKVNNPSPKKLISILNKDPLQQASILHYTGTMWGVGARLSAISTINRINELKQRRGAGMIVLVPNIMWFEEENIPVPDKIHTLMQQYFPGNLSIAFTVDDPRFEHVAVNGKVAFRVPQDPLLRLFIELLNEPIVSTSVNYSNLPAENDVARLEKIFGSWFDFALYPPKRVIQDGATASTLVEYFSKKEGGIEDLKCLREGSVPFYEVKESFSRPLVMFVCTANICRSPIAEKLFAKMIREQNLKLDTDSSGLLEGGHMISLYSMQLLMQQGVLEAQEHVSKQITPEMVAKSWLVLTMEERQRDFLRQANPATGHKILTLNEITGFTGDIADPHGSDIENYRKTYAIIEERLNILINKIKKDEIKLFKERK